VISKRVLILDNDPAGTKTERLLRAVPPRVCQYDVVAATSASQARALRLRPQAVDFAPFEHIVAMACGST